MSDNNFPGSETCIWTDDGRISRKKFIERQLEFLDKPVVDGDEAMDEGEENLEDKNPKDVDLEPSEILADLLQSTRRNFTERSADEVYQMEEEEDVTGDETMDDGEEHSEDKNPKDVDLESSKKLADLPPSVGRNFTERSADEVYQMEEEWDQGKENSGDNKD